MQEYTIYFLKLPAAYMDFATRIWFVRDEVFSFFPVDDFDPAIHQRCSCASSCSILCPEIFSLETSSTLLKIEIAQIFVYEIFHGRKFKFF